MTPAVEAAKSGPVFILRGIKTLLLWALLAAGLFWAATYRVQGRPLYKAVSEFVTGGNYKEGFRDLRMFFGGFLKSVGEEIQHEEVTDKDRKQFESLVKTKSQEGEKQ